MDGNEQTNIVNKHGHDLVMECLSEHSILGTYGVGTIVVRCKLCNRSLESPASKTVALTWFNTQACQRKLPAWAYDPNKEYGPGLS